MLRRFGKITKSIGGKLGRSKDMMRYFTASALTAFVSIVLNPFVAICMSKEDFAITGYYSSFNLLLLPLVSFSLLQFYSKSYYRHDEQGRKNILNTIVCCQFLFGGISLGLWCLGYYIYNVQQNIDIPYFPYAILFFSSVFFAQFYSNYQTKLKFEKNSKQFLYNSIFNSAIHTICVCLFVLAVKMHALGYAIASLCPSLIMAVYSLKHTMDSFYIDRTILRQALLFCWPLILANLMEFIYSGIDRSFLVGLKDTQQLGVYNIAISIGGYVMIFYTTIAQTFQPDLFESVAKKDRRSTIRLVCKIQLLNVVPILLFIIFAPQLIYVLTFGRYMDSVPFARIIALKGIFAALYFSLSSVIIAAGLSKVTLLNKTLGTVLVYFLFDYLVSRYAYFGAAWGQALSYVIMIAISLVFIWYNRRKIFT